MRALIAAAVLFAQAPDATRFEVASIKRNNSVGSAIGGRGTPDTYRRTNATLLTIIREAYRDRFLPWEIDGTPAWFDKDKFDIVAKTNGSRWTMEMVQALLAERFKLRAHEEIQERDVYRWAVGRRRVVDETGLAGYLDIDLTWDPTFELPPDQRVPSDSPSIFTALREQLGLRLEPTKMRVPVLVIDSVALPAED